MEASKSAPESTDTAAKFSVTASAESTAQAKILVDTNRYVSKETPNQQVTPRYEYNWSVKWWNTLKVSTDLGTVTTSIMFAKFADTDEDFTTPIKGAVYSLYKKSTASEDTFIKDVTTESTYIEISGLTEGDYYFVEKNPLMGYDKNEEKVEFTVTVPDSLALTAKINGYTNSISIDKDTITANPNWDSGNKNKINNMSFSGITKQTVSVADAGADCFIQNKNSATHVTSITYSVEGCSTSDVSFKFNGNTYTSETALVNAINAMIDNGTIADNYTIQVMANAAVKDSATNSFIRVAATDPITEEIVAPDNGVDTLPLVFTSLTSAAALAYVFKKKHNN